ncbi:MarR family winged helix-turn-helix transcriptional regulator [Amycolatopsis sp. WQ 127309]|uniref:MarR family winged helix-turn-helix transcriptional regulator n=1 Tax=Amycolatopsis sp. WQ 127309 TaxID=2932773 RepID=UPI001FF487BA|nr:MarR family transcriptional regulator [Amycolatopsis sp. WQ 127309]UOZ03350.1 MarR family transcriptional regulator [Amycolatopsis sp. WQ 127309]
MPQRNESAELARAVMDLIDQGHRRISRRIDLTRVRILGLIGDRAPVRPSTIAAELGLTASATSRHLTALEQAGQIAVEPDPDDQRTFLVRPTEAGHADIDATVEAGARVFAEVIADWTDEDVATARQLITRLNEAWARRADPPRPTPGPRWRRTHRIEES